MLIARACPIMSVYSKHGGQRGYKGHVLNMPQEVQGFLDRLPCEVSQLPIVVTVQRTHMLISGSEEAKSWGYCSGFNRTIGATWIS